MTGATSLVCVVDDDPSVRRSIERLLRSEGYEVETHGDAASFLDRDASRRCSCLVLDVRMPGMTGLELYDELAENGAPPVVFVSGHGDIEMAVRAMKAGAVDFLSKPFESHALIAAIAEAIARGGA